MRINLPIVGPDKASRSKEQDPQKTVNMYLRAGRARDKSPLILYSCPGLTFRRQLKASGARSNLVVFDGELWVVIDNQLVSLESSGGFLNTTSGRVEMAVGRDRLVLVDGTNGYYMSTDAALTQITDEDFPNGATHVTYLDGRFIVNDPSTGRFYISDIENPFSWDALDYATGEADPDATLALAANYKNLYLFGRNSTEIWYNSGNADFPFEPYPGGVLEVGIQAPHSLVRTSGGLFWLGTSREGGIVVVQADGQQNRVISEPINWDLTQMEVTDDAIGSAYRWDGRTVYRLTFPTEDRSFEYYAEDDSWIERKSKGIGRHRAAGFGYFNNEVYAADYANGKIYTLDYRNYTEDGDYIERVRETETMHSKDVRLCYHAVYIDIESGVGLVSGQGVDPQMMLSWSDDGGKTWSNEVWASMGKLGAYSYRATWRRLGSARQRIYRIRVTDPVDVTILGGYADVTEQRS